MKTYKPTKQKTVAYISLFGLIIINILSFKLLNLIGLQTYNYILRPIFWIGVIIFLIRLKPLKTEIPIKKKSMFMLVCAIAGLGYAGSYMMLGAIKGFGLNPFDVSIKGIFYNLINFYPYYLGLELIRYRLINSQKRLDKKHIFVLIIIVYTFIDFNPMKFIGIIDNNLAKNVEFIGSEVMPVIMLNVLLTRVAMLGGWKESSIIKLFYESLFFFFKILPNLDWLTKAFLNIMFPLFTFYLINEIALKEDRDICRRGKKENTIASMFTYVISILIVWFSVGVFPVFPTLVLTGSMEPAIYPGDVVIMKNVENDEIEVGDVIQFHTQNFFIIHRVIDIKDGIYVTKGDNNNVADSEPVYFEQIKGKLVKTIPKIGKPTLFIRSKMSEPRKEVEKNYKLGDKNIESEHK